MSTGTTMLVWEGTSDDGNELSIVSPSADPGSDIAITLPSATGTLVTSAEVLTFTNTDAFTPDADYEPATKKYVDDNIAAGSVVSVGDSSSAAALDGTDDGGTWIKFYDADGATQLIGGNTAGAVVLTLPTTTGTVYASNNDGELDALAGLTSAANKVPYFTGSGTADVADLTAFGRNLGCERSDINATVNLEANTDFYAPAGTDVALADGGTGASLVDPGGDRITFWDDSAGAITWLSLQANVLQTSGTELQIVDSDEFRTAAGLAIGTDVLAPDGDGSSLTGVDAATGDSATAFFDAGTIEHERGGLEANVSAYSGIVAVSGGSTIEVNTAAELETYAGLGAFANEFLDDANAAAVRTTLGLVIGTNVLAPNGDGSSLTGVDAATGDSATAFFDAGTIEHERGGIEADISAWTGLIGVNGSSSVEVDTAAELETYAGLGAFANEYLDDADAATMRTTLGLVIGTNVLAPNGDGSSLTNVVTAATVGAVSDNLDDADASIEWEDAIALTTTGTLDTDAAIGDTAFTDINAGSTYTNFGDAGDTTINTLMDAIDTAFGLLGSGTGDVVGPGPTVTDNVVARFDGTGGYNIQDSGVVIDDSDNVTGIAQLTATTISAATTAFAVDASGNVTGTSFAASASTTPGVMYVNDSSVGGSYHRGFSAPTTLSDSILFEFTDNEPVIFTGSDYRSVLMVTDYDDTNNVASLTPYNFDDTYFTMSGNEISLLGGISDAYTVKIDSGAVAGYLGAADSDGVLRSSSPIIYTDGGDYITLSLDVDDTPENGITAVPISSNWAYDHENAADPHTGYVLESGLGTGVGTFLATPSGANLASALTTALPASKGGTGQTSYTTGDILYASGASALSKLAGVATGNALISGGVGTAPSWGKVGLTTHVSGILPVANGGTNNAYFTVSGPATSAKTYTFPNANTTIVGTTTDQTLTTKTIDATSNTIKLNTINTQASPLTTNPYTLTAANSYGAMIYYGATGEIDLPALADGMNLCVYNTGAFTISLDPNVSEIIVREGTAQTEVVTMTLSSGAGNYVCLVSDGSRWTTIGYRGVLAAGS